MFQRRTYTPEETANLGKELSKGKNRVLCLYGELGAGKTTFVRGLAKGLSIHSRISSPTFTLQRVHTGPEGKLYHFDCYRTGETDDLLKHEIEEAIQRNDGILAIEWAEKIENFLPKKRTEIHFRSLDKETRSVTIKHIF